MMLTGRAQLAGVVGWPVSHSMSPALHGYWLSTYGIDGAYVPLAVKPKDLEAALRALPSLGFRGVNLTIPHKETAMHLVDEVDSLSRRIGAINTIFVEGDGRLRATNTDGFGFLANLQHSLPEFNIGGGTAIVLGAGGAARSVVAALCGAGVSKLYVTNRTRRRAERLADAIGGPTNVVPWAERHDVLDEVGLVVNATALGMDGKPSLDLLLNTVQPDAVIADLVYSPQETPLLKTARLNQHPTLGGLGMLLYQAVPGFEGWFGVKPEVTEDLLTHILAE